ALAASFLSGLNSGGTLNDSVSVTNLLFGINDYLRQSQALGCSDNGLEVALANFVTNARTRSLSLYGFDTNGNLSDQTKFSALSDDQLDSALAEALQFEDAGQRVGVDTGPVAEKVVWTILQERRRRLLVGLQTIRNAKYPDGPYADVDG